MVNFNDGCKAHIFHRPGMPHPPFAFRLFLHNKWHTDHWHRHGELYDMDRLPDILEQGRQIAAQLE